MHVSGEKGVLNGVLGVGRITQKAVGSSVERWQASAQDIL
jgi:hypothetical protein